MHHRHEPVHARVDAVSTRAAVTDAWEREPVTGRHFAASEPFEFPTHGKDRLVFSDAYGHKFTGDNHAEAFAYAEFCVRYLKGMKLPPYDGESR